MALVLSEVKGSVGTLIMNHPARRNALSEALTEEMFVALEQFREQKLRVVVLRAQPGSRIWSAGHDVRELPETRRDPLAWNDPLRRIVRSIAEFPAPVIALIEGGVWGGACELALSCDITVATPESTFAITPAKLGIPYNMTGLLNFMNVMPFSLLKEMAFTAQPVDAERALLHSMINHVVPAMHIDAFVGEMTDKIAANAPLSVAAMKESLRILAGAHAISPNGFERLQGLRRTVWDSHDYVEGINAFLTKRKPQFTGE
jgi:methylmalonyl-CoA decarboxylase